MGNTLPVFKTYKQCPAFLIERLISSDIIIGISKEGCGIKFNERKEYFPLINCIKYENKVDYQFGTNNEVFLTIQKTGRINERYNKNILGYELKIYDKTIIGEVLPIYKTIGMNSEDFDYIADLIEIKE